MAEEIITPLNFNKKYYLSRLKRFFEKSIFSCKLYQQTFRKEIEKNFKDIVKTISSEITRGEIFKDNYIKTYLQHIEAYIQYIREYSSVINKPSIPKSIVDSSAITFLDNQHKFMEELKQRFVTLPSSI